MPGSSEALLLLVRENAIYILSIRGFPLNGPGVQRSGAGWQKATPGRVFFAIGASGGHGCAGVHKLREILPGTGSVQRLKKQYVYMFSSGIINYTG